MRWSHLPNKPLQFCHGVTELFLQHHLANFVECVKYVHRLPYRRVSKSGDYRLVLAEARGTCSTKHALLKQLADEQQIPLTLNMCILLVNKRNMPDLTAYLHEVGLHEIPEAHVYCEYEGMDFDITFPYKILKPNQKDIVYKESITADQIGLYKRSIHKTYMTKWMTENSIRYTENEIWNIREKCISTLSITNEITETST